MSGTSGRLLVSGQAGAPHPSSEGSHSSLVLRVGAWHRHISRAALQCGKASRHFHRETGLRRSGDPDTSLWEDHDCGVVDWSLAVPAGCSVESALEAASLHPARLLGLEKHKGTLDFGADAGQDLPRHGSPLLPTAFGGTGDPDPVLLLLWQISWCWMSHFTSGPPTSRASWCGRRRQHSHD